MNGMLLLYCDDLTCFDDKSLLIFLTFIILVITFMHGTDNYLPETNHVSRVYNVAAVLYVQFLLHVMLFRMLNVLCTFALALPAVCVRCTIWLFCVVP